MQNICNLYSSYRGGSNLDALLRPKCSLHWAPFDSRTLGQTGQQAILARTLETFRMYIASPKRAYKVRLWGANTASRFTLRILGDFVPSPNAQADIRISQNVQFERVLLDCVSVNSRLYADQLNGSACVNNSRLRRRYLFIVSVHAPSGCSSPEMKD